MKKFDLTTSKGREEWRRNDGARAKKRAHPVSPFVALIAAWSGNPGPLAELLRRDGHEELAEAFELGEVTFKPMSEDNTRLLDAAIEFREHHKDTDWNAVAKTWRKDRLDGKDEKTGEPRKWKGSAYTARQRAIADHAVERGVGADELCGFLDGRSRRYRNLRDHLPEHLFPDVGRRRKVPRP